MTALEAITD